MDGDASISERVAGRFRSWTGAPDLAPLATLDLSRTFDPFLPRFARQVIDVGGEVRTVAFDDRVDGLLLFVPEERIGSIFARSPRAFHALAEGCAPADLYSEWPGRDGEEVLDVLSVELRADRPDSRLRHPVRLAGPGDLESAASLSGPDAVVREVRWARAWVESGEQGFLAEVDGVIAGVGWAGVAGDRGRLHSLAVHPRFRGLGVGSALLEARLRWLERAGAIRAVSEVGVGNAPSSRIAARAGLRPVGRMFRSRWT